jgi:hypothetical protein
VRAIALLLNEELVVVMVALQLAPSTASSSAPPPPTYGGDVATLHTQVSGIHNICSLVSTVLDPSSIVYTHWRNQVLLTLKRYDLADHILSDALPVNDPTWEHMESVILSCIFGTIIGKLQKITKECGVAARQSGSRLSTSSSAATRRVCFILMPHSATRVTSR